MFSKHKLEGKKDPGISHVCQPIPFPVNTDMLNTTTYWGLWTRDKARWSPSSYLI
jgi:hypothetical protein